MAGPFTFLIVHGIMGSPDINWFPWLNEKLLGKGQQVLTPQFPTPDGHHYANWEAVAFKALEGLNPARIILVGHSIGATFALRLAEKAQTSYAATFAVAPFTDKLGLEPYDTLNASFCDHGFQWDRIVHGMGRGFLYAGDNDPYVPLSAPQKIADCLDLPLNIIPGGGHLNQESGYTSFDKLWADISQLI